MDKNPLEHHNAVLSAIVNISQQLFVAGDFEEKLARSLAQLTDALNITHVYILQNNDEQNGRTLNHRYEWSRRQKEIILDAPEFQQISYVEIGFERWEKMLAEGEVVYGRVTGFLPNEQDFLRKRGILSIMAAPIQQGEHWWGIVILDDHLVPRQWNTTDVEAIRSLGNILGAAFATQQLYVSRKRLETKPRSCENLREL